MKKAITLLLAAALLASMCACGNKNTANTDETAEETVEGYDENIIYDEDLYDENMVISEGGTEAGLWPSDSVPSDVPAFEAYTNMNPANYQKSAEQEIWGMGFDTTAEGVEEYYTTLTEAGFRRSTKIASFWGNGEVLLDIEPENNGDGTVWLSIDIYKNSAITFPEALNGQFPEFKTDSTVWYWISDDSTLDVSYVCGSNFESDLATYKETLKNDGFTVEETSAKKESGGKTYIVEYSTGEYEDTITYSCNG